MKTLKSMEYDAYEAEIVEAYEAKLREKDAEIERLELDLSNALGDSQDKDAEIERLTRELREEREAAGRPLGE